MLRFEIIHKINGFEIPWFQIQVSKCNLNWFSLNSQSLTTAKLHNSVSNFAIIVILINTCFDIVISQLGFFFFFFYHANLDLNLNFFFFWKFCDKIWYTNWCNKSDSINRRKLKKKKKKKKTRTTSSFLLNEICNELA